MRRQRAEESQDRGAPPHSLPAFKKAGPKFLRSLHFVQRKSARKVRNHFLLSANSTSPQRANTCAHIRRDCLYFRCAGQAALCISLSLSILHCQLSIVHCPPCLARAPGPPKKKGRGQNLFFSRPFSLGGFGASLRSKALG